MGLLGAVTEKTYTLRPQGEYVFTLVDIEVSQGDWGDRLKWVWEMSYPDHPEDPIYRENGDADTLFQWTNTDLVVGSRQFEWAQILSGRTLEPGDEAPEDDELIRRRMVAYLTHETVKKGKRAGQKQETIVEGSARPFTRAVPRRNAPRDGTTGRRGQPAPENAQYRPSPHVEREEEEGLPF
jgi:hypothetical protein